MAKKGFIQKNSKDIPSFDVCNANLDDGAQVKGLHRSYLVTPNASLLTEAPSDTSRRSHFKQAPAPHHRVDAVATLH